MTLYRAALIVILAGIFSAALVPFLNTDLWWHLHTGRMIVEGKAVPVVDTLSFTAVGRPWLNHEWLSEVVFFLVHRRFGVIGLLVLIAAVMTGAMFLVHRRMRRRGVDPAVALVLLLPAWFATIGSAGLRIQPFTLLLLSLFLFILERDRDHAGSPALFALPPLMLLWANLHGGFAAGAAVMAIELAGSVIDSRRFDLRTRRLALVFVASALAAFIHPAGWRQVLYPLRFLRPNPFTRVINESQPVTVSDPIGAVFIGMLLLLVATAIMARRRIRSADLILAAALTWLAFSQLRHVSVWSMAVVPILGECVTGAVRRWGGPRVADGGLPAPRRRALHWAIAVLGVAAFIGIVVRFLTPTYLRDLERRSYPQSAMNVLASSPERGNLFSEYRWAGYAIWRLSPRYRLFIDGRADTVYDAATLAEYFQLRRAERGWEAILERRGVEVALLRPDAPLALRLGGREGWEEIFRDGQAVVFRRHR